MATGKKGRPSKPTAQTLKLQELWLRAAKAPVELVCADKASAMLIRFQLYNAVKPVRENPELNPELAEVLETVQVRLAGEQKEIVRIGYSDASRILDEVFINLGITGNGTTTKTELDLEIAASQARLLEKLGSGEVEEPAQRVTPYYTREN